MNALKKVILCTPIIAVIAYRVFKKKRHIEKIKGLTIDLAIRDIQPKQAENE